MNLKRSDANGGLARRAPALQVDSGLRTMRSVRKRLRGCNNAQKSRFGSENAYMQGLPAVAGRTPHRAVPSKC